MKVVYENFTGENPSLEENMLPPNAAIRSLNVDTSLGTLRPRPVSEQKYVYALPGTEYFHMYRGNNLFEFPSKRRVVERVFPNDTQGYAIIVGEGYPKITRADIALSARPFPAQSFRLGIPQPSRPRTSVDGAPPAEPNDLDLRRVAYRISWTDGFGFEGPLSPASAAIDYYQGTQGIKVSMAADTAGCYKSAKCGFNVYRANMTGSGEVVYQLVSFENIQADSFWIIDRALDKDLEYITGDTSDFFGPPDERTDLYPDGPMFDCAKFGDFIIGVAGNEVLFSEPNVPYAWPITYRRSLEHKTIAVMVASNSAIVFTNGPPYVVIGSHPSAMDIYPLEAGMGCINVNTIVDMGAYVVYATTEGFAVFDGANVRIITQGVFDERWMYRNLGAFTRCYAHGHWYVMHNTSDIYVKAFDTRDPINTVTSVSASGHVLRGFTHPETHKHWFVTNENYPEPYTRRLQTLWDGGVTGSFTYLTAHSFIDDFVEVALVQIIALHYPIDIDVVCILPNGFSRRQSRTVTSREAIWLQSGFVGRNWYVSVKKYYYTIFKIILAQSGSEIDDI